MHLYNLYIHICIYIYIYTYSERSCSAPAGAEMSASGTAAPARATSKSFFKIVVILLFVLAFGNRLRGSSCDSAARPQEKSPKGTPPSSVGHPHPSV